MPDKLASTIYRFLKERNKGNLPILLGFSGGPDSLALLHLLLQCRPLKIGLAHVDHGWRQESHEEAEKIGKMAAEFGLPFHLKTLIAPSGKGNLEAQCREERLRFFAAICQAHGYHAVMLAHHADDLAETVLKRTFEGASLTCLEGLRPETVLCGIKIWRPLLPIFKSEIIDWLGKRGLEGFQDSTNSDPDFLRTRLRTDIMPLLSDAFGKEVKKGLCRFGTEAGELKEYLDERISPYLSHVVDGCYGPLLDLSTNCPAAPFEIKHLIRRFCEKGSLFLSRESLVHSVESVVRGSANQVFEAGDRTLYIDRRRLFVFAEIPKLTLERVPISKDMTFGPWKVEVSSSESSSTSDWRSLWTGKGEVVLPPGNYALAVANLRSPYPKSLPLSKWWTDHKVPAILRHFVPVILQGNQIKHEFLTGKTSSSQVKNALKISLASRLLQ